MQYKVSEKSHENNQKMVKRSLMIRDSVYLASQGEGKMSENRNLVQKEASARQEIFNRL